MARTASGTVVWDEDLGIWRGRFTLKDGARPWIDCPAGLPHNERGEARAREYISERAEIARKENLTASDFKIVRRSATSGKAPTSESVSVWYGRYYDWKEERGDASVRDARGRFATHIEPIIGHLLMSDVTSAKLEDIRDRIDREVRAGKMSWKTGRNVWNEITAAFRQATSSKNRALRVLTRNPADGIAPPDKGDEREKPFLFPDEVVMLLSCRAIPLYRRVAYAVAIYTGVRSAELEALTSADCDVEHLQIMIARQADRDDRSKDKKTKTKIARPIEMEPALVPLLELLIAERPDGRMLHLPPPEDRPEKLREDLERAGCTREALKADDETRAPMKFHNLRDTCLTHMVARKDDPWRVQARARHTSIAMTQKYIGEQGTRIGAAFGTPFPPLPASLVDDVRALGSRHGSKAAARPAIVPAIVRRTQRHKSRAPKSIELERNSHVAFSDPSGNRKKARAGPGRKPARTRRDEGRTSASGARSGRRKSPSGRRRTTVANRGQRRQRSRERARSSAGRAAMERRGIDRERAGHAPRTRLLTREGDRDLGAARACKSVGPSPRSSARKFLSIRLKLPCKVLTCWAKTSSAATRSG